MFRQFAPAPCSPPLGGSDENSAVRFTAAVKYGGRENRLSRRETGYMSGHPRRAHHKLEWARKVQSGIKVLYEQVPRSESSKVIITQSRSYYMLRVCKAASRTRLRYMVECGQCGAAHTTCCAPAKAASRARLRFMVERGPAARNQSSIAGAKHLPAFNSGLWLSAGSAPTFP